MEIIYIILEYLFWVVLSLVLWGIIICMFYLGYSFVKWEFVELTSELKRILLLIWIIGSMLTAFKPMER